jgi:2-desacetyl-2-hydroxyethyl bacteriochlorophyllide A dehydrogenase
MLAVEYRGPEELALVQRPQPEAQAGQLVVEVANCGICGSDLHSFTRGFAAERGQVLGHEFCGAVVEAPGVTGVAVGDRVTVRPLIPCGQCARCRSGQIQLCEAGHAHNIGYGSPGAFAERVLVPRAILGETVFLLPDTVDDRAGALVEPLSVALRAVRLAAPAPDDVALVLGGGTIGLGVARFLRLSGVRTLVVADPSPLRRERAVEQGADVVVDPVAENTVEVMRESTGPGGFGLGARADLVIDCAGAPAAFADGLKSVRHGGTMVLCAMYSSKVELRPDRIVEKELTIRGSFAYLDEFPAVIRHLADGSVDVEALISHTFPLDRTPEAFRAQLDRVTSLKVLVTPRPI